ncbi:glycoside hydrolase superfamily [Lipomyces doorenjongii]
MTDATAAQMAKTTEEICFVPEQGRTVFATLKTFDVYAIANRADMQIEALLSDGSRTFFTLIDVPSLGSGHYTFQTSIEVRESPLTLRYSYMLDGAKTVLDGYATVIPTTGQHIEEEFTSVIELNDQQDFANVRIPWLKVEDWQGWVWLRPRSTWIEPRWITLLELPEFLGSHFFLLQPTNHVIDPATSFCIFPCSSAGATVNLSASRHGEDPGVYARVRRVKAGGVVKAYVVGKMTANANVFNAVDGAIDLAKKKLGTSGISYVLPPNNGKGTPWPFSQLSFCTWSSIGENIRPTRTKLEKLVQSLKTAQIPVGSFLIDDGWQDIRSGMNGVVESRGLWSFDVWDGMDCSLKESVSIVKDGLPTVENVGVWMTLQGYWNSVASKSPLIAKYRMRPFKLSQDCVPGLTYNGFDGQTVSQPDESDRLWWLPPKELAYQFWKDYFSYCADAGITFAKVDDQSYCSFLAGVDGAEEAFAMWDGMTRAADDVFGEARVIHSMAHYERTFNGDIGMGLATKGNKVVFRNTDDFGLPGINIHRNHVHYNLMNCIIMSRMCIIPDADMFMSGAKWPEFHAVLRAFFPGPVLLSDRAEEHDLSVIHKLIGRTIAGRYEVVKSHNPALPLSSRIWEPSLASGIGPSIKAASYVPAANSSALIMWSSRDGAAHSSTDIILSSDIADALGQHILPDTKYVLWFAEMKLFICFDRTRRCGSASSPLAEITLAPEGHEVVTVAPFHKLGHIEIACLGLLNKYAGLSAIDSIEFNAKSLRACVLFEGELGFIVTDASCIKVYVNCESVTFAMLDLSQTAVLVKIALTVPDSSSEVARLGYWTVDVQCA